MARQEYQRWIVGRRRDTASSSYPRQGASTRWRGHGASWVGTGSYSPVQQDPIERLSPQPDRFCVSRIGGSGAVAEVDRSIRQVAGTISCAIRTIQTPACVCVRLIGELDVSGVDRVNGCVDALLSAEPRPARVIVDLHELCFADVVGIRTLVMACCRLRRIGALEVYGIRPPVQRVLELTSMTFSEVCDRVDTTSVRSGRTRFTGV
jgi:anti-anti-sigma factor